MNKLAFVGKINDFYNFLSRSFSGEIVCFDDMESAGTVALDDDYVSIVATSERNNTG